MPPRANRLRTSCARREHAASLTVLSTRASIRIFEHAIKSADRRLRVLRQNAAGQQRKRRVRLLDFTRIRPKRFDMLRDDRVIAARERAGPCSPRAEALYIIEH